MDRTILSNEWHVIMRRAWSIRLLAIAWLLTMLENALPLLDFLHLPRWASIAVAIASPVVIASAFVARLLPQRNLRG